MSRFTVFALMVGLSFSLKATQLFTNPGFETGTLSGWNLASTAGSDDDFFPDNTTTTPLNGDDTVGPDSGSWYAVSDMTGLVTPESTSLTQTITIPLGTTSDILSVDMFVNDEFGGSGLGGEIAIWANGANPLVATPLFVAFGPTDTAVAGGIPNPYVVLSLDVTSHLVAGTTYVIGALESDSTGPINVGVDNFSLVATSSAVPEPSTLLLTGFLAVGMLIHRTRRK
ncbi:MAG TPA: PEP-CTERM sorting domain-containing protein [Bryobacteraceae bacterium]|jgi:hypothetical protein|nr:PEP-CTERM sorting domain-containing protein [Bryobacteraceae bacterium]